MEETTMDTAPELEVEDGIATVQDLSEISEYELERGKPMPNEIHGSVQANLLGLFIAQYKKQFRFISELTIEVGEKTAVPDICIYAQYEVPWQENVPAAKVEPPLVAIEIISPSQTFSEMRDKARQYFAHGVKSCWIVQPELQTISVLHLGVKPRTFDSGMVEDIIVGISIPVEEVFE